MKSDIISYHCLQLIGPFLACVSGTLCYNMHLLKSWLTVCCYFLKSWNVCKITLRQHCASNYEEDRMHVLHIFKKWKGGNWICRYIISRVSRDMIMTWYFKFYLTISNREWAMFFPNKDKEMKEKEWMWMNNNRDLVWLVRMLGCQIFGGNWVMCYMLVLRLFYSELHRNGFIDTIMCH